VIIGENEKKEKKNDNKRKQDTLWETKSLESAQGTGQKAKKPSTKGFSARHPRKRALGENWHYTLTCDRIPFSFSSYYTTPTVNCFFEALNGFKLKGVVKYKVS
jgi:hypothetical protein